VWRARAAGPVTGGGRWMSEAEMAEIGLSSFARKTLGLLV
jgi:hypothetical protein